MTKGLAFRAALTMLLLGGGAAVAAAQVTIFRSSGPSARRHPVGTRLPADARLMLRPGDTVVVTQGEFARVFRGPGTFVARMTDPIGGIIGGVAGGLGGSGNAGSGGRPRSNGFGGSPHVQPQADGALSRFYICPQHPRCPR